VVASHKAVLKMSDILLKYMDMKTAKKMIREMYNRVDGNQSLMKTLVMVINELEEREG